MPVKALTLLRTTVAATALFATGALAQTNEATTPPTNESDTTLTAPVSGGQVVVEQAEPTVNVTIDEPTVTVDRATPEVTVEQPAPEVIVTQQKPTVTVQQQAPIITVEQAQPEVIVRIPEPIVTVRVPDPQVNVDSAEPQISVEQPQPIVRFVRPEPKITIQEQEPEIRVERAEADVNVNAASAANVTVEQAEANVELNTAGEADVQVETAEARVNVEEADGADVTVEQADADVRIDDAVETATERASMDGEAAGDDATIQMMASNDTMTTEASVETDRAEYTSIERHALSERTIADIIGMNVLTDTGEDVGEIDYLGMRDGTPVGIVGVGGLFGLGENEVALPLERFTLRGDQLVLEDFTQEELESMPEYRSSEVDFFDASEATLLEMVRQAL